MLRECVILSWHHELLSRALKYLLREGDPMNSRLDRDGEGGIAMMAAERLAP